MDRWVLGRAPQRLPDMDVVVVGGGCAGTLAAVAAGRRGARVLLVERDGGLGGTSTGVLDTFYGFFTPGPGGRQLVGGLPWEVVERLRAGGHAFDRPNTYGAGIGITYNPQVLQGLWDQLCVQAGVQVLSGCHLADVAMADGRPAEVLLLAGTELLRVRAGVFVDASGDGVLAALAGARSEGYADIPNPQSLTTTFTMAPVDQAALRQLGRAGLVALLTEADRNGYRLARREGSLHPTTADGVEFVHMTRVAARDPRDPVALSAAEREGRAQVMECARFLVDRVPGFERARVTWLARRIGVREGRRVVGRYWLSREDVLDGRRFDDAIAQGAAPIEEHAAAQTTRWEFLPGSGGYDIPFRSLLPVDVAGLLVAGRCFSASHDAHASARNMAQCMAMGQAAGTAAALSVAAAAAPHEIDVPALQAELQQAGVLLAGTAVR